MGQRSSNWNLTAAYLYGRVPSRVNGGTRVSMNGTSAISMKLTPGFYEVYGVKSSTSGMMVFIADGDSSITASTKSYMIPANQSCIFQVDQSGENAYIAGITYPARVGTLCIYKY
jgi:hypothetical protein